MKTRKVGIFTLVVAVLFPNSGWAGKTQKYPVEIVFRDASDDGIQSDGLGAYVDGVDGVRAQIIDDRGRLDFSACRASRKDNVACPGLRRIFFDFSNPATDALGAAADPGPTSLGLPFVSGLADSGMAVNLVDVNEEYLADGLLGMSEVGERRLARSKSNFKDSNGVLFTVRFRPGNEPDSNWVLVTYLGGQVPCDDSTPCASWIIEAWTGTFTDPMDMCCPTHELYDIGTLVSDNTNDEGDYHLPFLMTVTVLPESEDGGGPGGGKGGGKGKRN